VRARGEEAGNAGRRAEGKDGKDVEGRAPRESRGKVWCGVCVAYSVGRLGFHLCIRRLHLRGSNLGEEVGALLAKGTLRLGLVGLLRRERRHQRLHLRAQLLVGALELRHVECVAGEALVEREDVAGVLVEL